MSQSTAQNLPPCDLVMRGGITSGVVYPGAIAELAHHFRFVQIGGASAGAIAAGVAAAAEYGRSSGANPGAFGKVGSLQWDIAGQNPDGTALPGGGMKRLFRPWDNWPIRLANRAAWTWLAAGARRAATRAWIAKRGGEGTAKATAAVLRMAGLAALALLGAWMIIGGLLGWPGAGAAASLAILAAVASALVVRWLLRCLPDANFGLCPGVHAELNRPDAAQDGSLLRREGALMDWLHATIQELAGRNAGAVPAGKGAALNEVDRPLLMRDLWGSADPTAARGIDILLTTTNLSQQLGHQFPFLEKSGSPLYFREAELARVLPRDAVRWMVRAAGPLPERLAQEAAWKGCHPLPAAADLPVVFGVRLSLSFPGLLAAVPLLSEDPDDRRARGTAPAARPAPRRCWFSDGGITSNFPIHVFDAPLPRRPTFCINLRGATAAEARGGDDALVGMARTNFGDIAPRFLSGELSGLGSFLGAVVATARNAQENEMQVTPGQRDRIVHVAMRKAEGGLNLEMPAPVILALSDRGQRAAKRIAARFDPRGAGDVEGPMGWANQRWIRLRSYLAAQERLLADVAAASRHRDPHWGDYRMLRRAWSPSDPRNQADPVARRPAPSYPWRSRDAAKDASRAFARLIGLALAFAREARRRNGPQGRNTLFDGLGDGIARPRGGAPRPKMGLRSRSVGADPRSVATYR